MALPQAEQKQIPVRGRTAGAPRGGQRWAAGLEKGLHGLKEIQRATHLFDEAAPRVGRGARFDST
jgi:hypothetical protein